MVVREGLLIKLEEELVKLGFEGTFAKQNEHLKKPLFLKEGSVDDVLKREMKGIYLDWNFILNKSVLTYVFFIHRRQPSRLNPAAIV